MRYVTNILIEQEHERPDALGISTFLMPPTIVGAGRWETHRGAIMMRTSYMPAKKVERVAWARNFVQNVTPNAAEYGISPVLMTEFTQINATLQTAWLTAENVETRTRGKIAAFHTSLKLMQEMATRLVRIIQGTPGVTAQMKIDAGVTVYKDSRTVTPPPTQKPVVVTTGVEGRNVLVELRQDLDKRAKAPNAVGATIFTYVGATPPTGASGWMFAVNTTKTKLAIPFPASDVNQTVWITAFWKNAKDQSGPASTPVSIMLPAGGVLPSGVNKMKIAA